MDLLKHLEDVDPKPNPKQANRGVNTNELRRKEIRKKRIRIRSPKLHHILPATLPSPPPQLSTPKGRRPQTSNTIIKNRAKQKALYVSPPTNSGYQPSYRPNKAPAENFRPLLLVRGRAPMRLAAHQREERRDKDPYERWM
ncbi:hypothetical protein M9H77_07868 [Catharanthus roseus]|uniref:Uncharacterized protein n=1 Tax=Catharanthus roseus TaxID=4058 RepID=A0ACC0BWL0_CATRO|nr:hypothetical protein M9H77_07868 [Catharanthus roseus]